MKGSEVWKVSLNNFQIIWKRPLAWSVTGVFSDRFGQYVAVDRYSDEGPASQLVFLDGKNGAVVDSLMQARGVFINTKGSFLYTEDYRLGGGDYLRYSDKNLYVKTIGKKNTSKIRFELLTESMHVSNGKLLLMAVDRTQPPLLKLLLAPLDTLKLLTDIATLPPFEYEGLQDQIIIDDSTAVVGDTLYRVRGKTAVSLPLVDKPLTNIDADSSRLLGDGYYSGNFYYSYSSTDKIYRTYFDPEFDDLTIAFSKLGRKNSKIVLDNSFFIKISNTIYTGIIKDNNKLILQKQNLGKK